VVSRKGEYTRAIQAMTLFSCKTEKSGVTIPILDDDISHEAEWRPPRGKRPAPEKLENTISDHYLVISLLVKKILLNCV